MVGTHVRIVALAAVIVGITPAPGVAARAPALGDMWLRGATASDAAVVLFGPASDDAMLANVVASVHDAKVGRAIVAANVVDMMHMLVMSKATSKHLLHDHAVQYPVAVHCHDMAISIGQGFDFSKRTHASRVSVSHSPSILPRGVM